MNSKMSNMTRLKAAVRREQILKAAVAVAERDGLYRMTREQVALKAKVAAGLVNWYFGTMQQLRRAVMHHAVNHEILRIVAHGVINKDPQAMKAPENLRNAALTSVMG